ncbi:N-acetyl-gamma-glutamyl-phosphate reductase [Geminisphaera colitermitum]|uniref:N-acetyl-gamma-glutamyl-phosphate reductase n=1 Tax=Geminisphaera colitermitum TaxID=1148786 RepID=UPI000158CF2B|nr:N-acetyl-gamma-glutamyl-phosphate reductase [Geminisphaera colitermitum]
MKTKVFVDGQEGTTGLQIFERLAARADVEVIAIDPDKRKDSAARAACLNAADVAFLCLPDAAAKESAALVTNPRTCVIDASTAHRVNPAWAYGLPELGPAYRDAISTPRPSKRIANPGCHATAFLLAVRPLVARGLVPADFALSAFSITGYSGGGKKMIADYEQQPAPAKFASPRPYALGLAHKHLPEMRVHAGLVSAPIFNPVVAAFYKGLAVTVPLPLASLPGRPTAAALHAALTEAYAGERFIRVLPLGDASGAVAAAGGGGGRTAALDEGFFDVQACNDTNRCDLAVFGNADGSQAVIIARLDNLGKGASGAAVQCMNLHLGLDEGAGLDSQPES